MVIALAATGLMSPDAQASKRLGSGASTGKQSSIATQKQATPPQAAPTQAAALRLSSRLSACGSRWLGPLAGLAAGLGLAALASHFGFGEELANFMLIALMVIAVLFIIRMVMARRQAANQSSGSAQPAWAAAGAASASMPQQQPVTQSDGLFGGMNQGASAPIREAAQPWGVPAGFDVAGFVENAKHYFRRLQAANDAGNLDELREFTSAQLFNEFAAEIRTRQGENYTELVRLDAELLGIETQDGEYLASVRFSGLIREGRDLPPQSFDEVWNLSKPLQGQSGWVLSGIQ
ncbi:MAG: Tim44 domain-containing protein, partial [Betaproteobacteria bacterium]|nr:Tim44 domain-containing protein [Betaproteobacteria bacterium]